MDKEAIKKLREAEEILLRILRGITLKEDRLGVLKPAELEAAKVFADLMRIETAIQENQNKTN